MTCAVAVKYRQFKCLKYAHENSCPWNVNLSLTSIAADNGDLECLKYS